MLPYYSSPLDPRLYKPVTSIWNHLTPPPPLLQRPPGLNSTTTTSNMPYRAELKRPDLKGTFPCSVCNKIFCHSSSLSRHRMQAHFKSYTCTLCNEEIASNETLRSHMFKVHQISRMFMCRCCNWAFPDKTSLHIHMQSMVRSGLPGDVNILAKGADAPGSALSPGMTAADLYKTPNGEFNESDYGVDNVESDETESPSLVSKGHSIFPNVPNRDNLFNELRMRAAATQNAAKSMEVGGVKYDQCESPMAHHPLMQQMPEQATTQSLLALWLANNAMNPYAAAALNMSLTHGFGGGNSLNLSTNACPLDDRSVLKEEQSASSSPTKDDDTLSPSPTRHNASSTVGHDQHSQLGNTEVKVDPQESTIDNHHRSAISSNPMNSLMYHKKLTGALRNRTKHDASLQNFLHNQQPLQIDSSPVDDDEPCAKRAKSNSPSFVSVDEHMNQQQCSPTASHTSGSGPPLSAGSSDSFSPAKCSECQILKRDLGLAENRNRFLESKVSSLENKVERLCARVKTFEHNSLRHESEQGVLREQCESLEAKLLSCQDKALRFLEGCGGQDTASVALKAMVEDLLNTTYFQYDHKLRFANTHTNLSTGPKPILPTTPNHGTMAVQ